MTVPNGAAATDTYYDPASQLTSLVHAVGGAPFASFSYAYDPVGNRTSLTDLDGTHDYSYDALNRLIDATHPQPANPAESFAYDPVGNRTGSHLASSQIHDAANRLLEDSNFTYTYDESGNLTSKTNRTSAEVTTYTYDAENQLVRVDRPGTIAEYRYDALGRRIAKVVNGVSTRFVYDNEDMVAEVDTGGSVRALYAHGPGIDEPLAMFRSMPGVNTFLFHADGLGSITHLTNTAGAPARSYTYETCSAFLFQPGFQLFKGEGRLLSSRLNQLPKRGVGLEDDALPVFPLDTHEDRCWLSAAGNDYPVSLRLIDAFSDLLLKIADRHGFHRISSVLFPRGFFRIARTYTIFSSSETS